METEPPGCLLRAAPDDQATASARLSIGPYLRNFDVRIRAAWIVVACDDLGLCEAS